MVIRRAGVALVCLATLGRLAAGEVLYHEETPASLAEGRASGIRVTDRGRLFGGPAIEPLLSLELSRRIWTGLVRNGEIYLATGPGGRVERVDAEGKLSSLFDVEESWITAIAFSVEGVLFAATAPGGRIYRFDGSGAPELFAETGESYVWSLAVDGESGAVVAATGPRGRLLRVDRQSGVARTLFEASAAHLSVVVPAGAGWLVGAASPATVYEVDADGHARVLLESDSEQVAALAAVGEGLYVALVDRVAPDAPETRWELEVAPDDRPEMPTDPTRVAVIEPRTPRLAEIHASSRNPTGRRGRLLRVDERGRISTVWESARNAPEALAVGRGGELLFGTSEPARLYRVDDASGEVARIFAAPNRRVAFLAAERSEGVYVALDHAAELFRYDGTAAATARFDSRPVDAGHTARWGRLRADSQPVGTEFLTRTGDSSTPDATWSAWSRAAPDADGYRIDNPDGRFLQWRATFTPSPGSSDPSLHGIAIGYERHNRPPRRLTLRPEAAAGAPRFRFRVDEPDGDELSFAVEYARLGEASWRRGELDWEEDESSRRDPSRSGWLALRTENLDEGVYEMRVRVSDAPSNALDEAGEAVSDPPRRIVVDRTAPGAERMPSALAETVEVVVRDRWSALRAVELMEGERVVGRLRPTDGMCDSREERFVIPRSRLGGEPALRCEDAAGNRERFPLDP